MNFHDVWTRQQAEDLAPPPYIVRQEEQHRRRETERRLRIAERDERAAREWAARFPEDVAAENEHFRRRRAEKATRRAAKKEDRARRRAEKATKRAFIEAQLAGPTTIGEDDPVGLTSSRRIRCRARHRTRQMSSFSLVLSHYFVKI